MKAIIDLRRSVNTAVIKFKSAFYMSQVIKKITLLLVTALAIGCAGQDFPVTPCNGGFTSPPFSGSSQTVNAPSAIDVNHNLWGFWIVTGDRDSLEFDTFPLRLTSGHLNVTGFLEPPFCDDCFKISGVSSNPDGTLDVDITLRHPFTGLNLTGFDVRGIAMFNGTHEFPASGLVMSDSDLGDGELLNPDGYTTLYNPTTIGHGIEGYIKGKYASVNPPDATLNAFKYFTSDTPGISRNLIEPGQEITVAYHIAPPDPFIFAYAVDACWAPPVNKPVNDPVTDFDINANCPEAWRIVPSTTVNGEFTDCFGQMSVSVDVYDWQGLDNTYPLLLECPELFDGFIQAPWSGNGSGYTVYEALIENSNHAGPATFKCLIGKPAQENDPSSKPWLDLTAYQVFEIDVIPDIKQPPTAVATADKTIADIDEEILFDGTLSYDNDCGGNSIVMYEWDWNNDSTYDDEGPELSHSWGTEGTYYVQLRVTDDEDETAVLDEPMEITILEAPHQIEEVTPPYLNVSPNQIAIEDNYAYIGGTSGLHIYDISDPLNPFYIKKIETIWPVNYLDAENGIACLSGANLNLTIVDISSPADAHIVSTYDAKGMLVMDGNYVYLVGGNLDVIDLSEPSNPQLTGSLNMAPSGHYDLIKSGDYLYVACMYWNAGGDYPYDYASIIDVSAPSAPEQVSGFLGLRYIGVWGNYMYGISYDFPSTVNIYNISDPSSPSSEGSVTLSLNLCMRMHPYAGCLYFLQHENGIHVCNLDNPAIPEYSKTAPLSGYPVDMDFSGNYGFIANEAHGLEVIDLSSPDDPVWVSDYRSLNNVNGIGIEGDYAHLLVHDTFEILDISDPENSFIEKTLLLSHDCRAIDNSYGYAYVLSGDNPYNPVRLDIIQTDPVDTAHITGSVEPGQLDHRALDEQDGYIWASGKSDTILVIDSDPPDSPGIITSVPVTDTIRDIDVCGDYGFVLTEDSLKVIGTNPPESTSIVSSIPLVAELNQELVPVNGYAYGGVGNELWIFDIDPPELTHVVDTIDFTVYRIGALAVQDQYLFTACTSYPVNNEPIRVFDISNPEAPELIGELPLGYHDISDISVSGNYIYIAQGRYPSFRIFKFW